MSESLFVNLSTYISVLAKTKSGDNVSRTRTILLSLFKNELLGKEIDKIKQGTCLCIKEAFINNRTKSHPADAVSFRDLKLLIRRTRRSVVPPAERLALQAFIVALVTLSRMREVLSLTTEDVSRDGKFIYINPKVSKEGTRVEKRVFKDNFFRASEILEIKRKNAIRNKKNYVFRLGKDIEIPTGRISNLLMSLAKRLGVKMHITAHSARKTMASLAILKGVPIPVIKSWGLWASVDSLESYVGPSIRRLMPIIPLVRTGGSF